MRMCELHPQGECPRQEGDCYPCQFRKKYGGRVNVSPIALQELLRIKGDLVHIDSDPLTNNFDFYFMGDQEHFPELQEAMEAPRLYAICTVKEGIMQKVVLEDWQNKTQYVHYDREEELKAETPEFLKDYKAHMKLDIDVRSNAPDLQHVLEIIGDTIREKLSALTDPTAIYVMPTVTIIKKGDEDSEENK
jgi:hypothetical protein